MGIPLVVRAAAVDEDAHAGERPDAYLQRIARAKLEAALSVKPSDAAATLVADTIVVCDGAMLGKPRDRDDAIDIVRRLSGRAHEVETRFLIATRENQEPRGASVTTRVFVRALSAAWIERYADTKEGFDKAGSYAVQGIFAFAIERIEGSYTNVVGLPLCEVVRTFDELGMIPRFLEP